MADPGNEIILGPVRLFNLIGMDSVTIKKHQCNDNPQCRHTKRELYPQRQDDVLQLCRGLQLIDVQEPVDPIDHMPGQRYADGQHDDKEHDIPRKMERPNSELSLVLHCLEDIPGPCGAINEIIGTCHRSQRDQKGDVAVQLREIQQTIISRQTKIRKEIPNSRINQQGMQELGRNRPQQQSRPNGQLAQQKCKQPAGTEAEQHPRAQAHNQAANRIRAQEGREYPIGLIHWIQRCIPYTRQAKHRPQHRTAKFSKENGRQEHGNLQRRNRHWCNHDKTNT